MATMWTPKSRPSLGLPQRDVENRICQMMGDQAHVTLPTMQFPLFGMSFLFLEDATFGESIPPRSKTIDFSKDILLWLQICGNNSQQISPTSMLFMSTMKWKLSSLSVKHCFYCSWLNSNSDGESKNKTVVYFLWDWRTEVNCFLLL